MIISKKARLRLSSCSGFATVLTLAALLADRNVMAATFSWNNAGTAWGTAANWSTAVPTSADIASFSPQFGSGATINNPVFTGAGNVDTEVVTTAAAQVMVRYDYSRTQLSTRNAVPEPAGLALVGLALAAAGLLSRRRA